MGCYVGIDVAKHFHVAAIVDEAGQVLRTLHFDNNLTRFQRFAQIFLGGGDQTGQKGEEIQVVVAVTISGILVERDQGRGFQEQFRPGPQRANLSPVCDEKRLDVTTMAAKRNVIAVRVGEGGGAFDVVGNLQLAELAAECQFDSHARHDAS